MSTTSSYLIVAASLCALFHLSQQNIRLCGEPRLINGGYKIEGSFLVFLCDDGYELVGPARTKCIGRKWHPDPNSAECQKKSENMIEAKENDDQNCPAPPIIINGTVGPHRENGEPYRVGDELLVHCDFYYKAVQGDTYLRCIEGPRWNGTFPICIRSHCGPPPSINDGYLSYYDQNDSYPVGSQASVQCNSGFTKRKQEVTCQPDGTWDVEEAMCQEVFKDCLLPQPPKNGYLISESLGKIAHSEYDPKIMKFIPEDEYVSFSCDEKYRIEGEERIYCDEGSLEHDVPDCVKIYCDSPPAIENGYYVKRRSKKRVFKKVMYREGTKLFVNCTEEYHHKIGSPKTVQCLRVKNDLLWTSEKPICEKCGVDVRSPHRVFGEITKTYWPWMAMLRQFNKDDKTFYGFCGGSIIDRDWILTAAHCMYRGGRPIEEKMRNPENVYVRLGYTKSLNDTNIQDIKSSKIYIHPDYFKLANFDNDVALIKLAHSIEYEERVRPVCLCPPAKDIPDESNLYAEKTKGWAIGFGIFSRERKDESETFKTLREVALEIRSDEECGNGLHGSAIKTYTAGMFCAGGEKDKDTCHGDSGGPFMKQQNNADGTVSWIQTGITSFGPKGTCAKEGEYGYYTNVANVRDWIDKTIQVHGNNNCLLPQPPENGYLISDHWGIITHSKYDPEVIKFVMENTSVSFSCDDKFKIVGKDKIYCQEGELEHEVPMCVTMSCETPPSIENAVYEKLWESGSAFNYGDQIRFACNNDLVLVGAKTLTCSVKGWSEDFPSCQAMNCDNPELTEGVEIERSTNPLNSQNKYPYQTEIFYKCAALNYDLIGSSSQTCTENGWNGREPYCKLAGCLDPDIPENGRINQRYRMRQKYYLFGDSVTFSCTGGYSIEKESYQTERQASESRCTSDGTWTKIPRCIGSAAINYFTRFWNKEIYCLRPEHPENGRYLNLLPEEGAHYPINYFMPYECDPGFTLENPNIKSRKCHPNGKWTGYRPICIEATCDSPPEIPNAILQTTVHERKRFGKVTLLRMTTGFKVTYGCRDGHHMVPKGEDPPGLTCTGTGQWSEPNFDCQSSQCGAPPLINDGYLSVYDHSEFYHVGYRAGVQCNRGFIKKKEEVTCLPNGNWDVEEPMCQRTLEDPLCGLPPPINNGHLWVRDQSEFYPVGYRAGVQCHAGFIQRKKHVICQLDGMWDVEEVMCYRRSEALQCGPPPRINDGTLRYYHRDSYPVGTLAFVQCNPGFNKRKELVTCLENGKWDVEDTLCQGSFKARGCGPVPRIENGALQIYPSDELYFIGAMADVRCDRGYHQITYQVACLENGNWNITGRECQIKETTCGKVPRISNGIIQTPAGMQNYPVGTEANVICDQGFYSEKYVVICENNGHWELQDINCNKEMRHCEKPPLIPNHGFIHDFDESRELYPIGHGISYECEPNFKPVPTGFQNNACTNKGWLHAAPECVAEWCDPIPEIEYGYLKPPRKGKLVPNEDQLKVLCNAGFIPTMEFLSCNLDGSWNLKNLRCQRDRSTDCNMPEPIENGFIENISNLKEATYPMEHPITYKCREGYVLEGDDKRFCSDGGWSGEAPICKVRF